MTRGFLHFEGVLWNELPAFATKNLAFQKEANLIEDRGACAPRHYSQALSARDDIKMTCVHRTRLKLVARIAQKIAEALPRESIFSVHAPCWVLYCNKVRIFSKDISFTYKKARLLRYIEILRIIVIYESLIDARFVPPSYHLLMRFAISSRSTIVLGPVWGNPGRCNKMNSICISRIGFCYWTPEIFFRLWLDCTPLLSLLGPQQIHQWLHNKISTIWRNGSLSALCCQADTHWSISASVVLGQPGLVRLPQCCDLL